VPVLDGFLTAILNDEKIYELNKKTQKNTRNNRRNNRRNKTKKKELDAVALYCNRYENLQKYCKKSKFQKYNTYKNTCY
jgi:hypothetical protein